MSSVLRSQTSHFHQLVSDNSYIAAWCSSSTLAFDGLGHHNVYMCKDTATWFKPERIIHTWVRTWQMEKNITADKIQSWLKLNPDVLVKTNRPQYSVLWLHLLIQINEVTTANMFVLSPGALTVQLQAARVQHLIFSEQVLTVAVWNLHARVGDWMGHICTWKTRGKKALHVVLLPLMSHITLTLI